MATTITPGHFGTLDDGRTVQHFMLDNGNGLRVGVSDLGGIVTSLHVPDRTGQPGDVVLGFDAPQAYLRSPFIGALIGRYCNRIGNARFTLDGSEYRLLENGNGHQLHGGPEGFDKRLWQAEQATVAGDNALVLTLVSPDGDQGFPGTLTAQATFRLTTDNALHLHFQATTDQPTHVNLTHHGYFNLQGSGDVLHHELQILASRFTPVDETLIPTGALVEVAGSALDFRQAKAIGQDIGSSEPQLQIARGFDHNLVLDKGLGMGLAARVYDPESGRVMMLDTTEPGLQFYSGNFLSPRLSGKGRSFSAQAAFCLEPQHFPDSPNQPAFPATVLRPGETYTSETVFRFSTDA